MALAIFDKINQISVLANEIRFKILLALFNSDMEIKDVKLGTHSHSFSDIQQIVGIEKSDLSYHLSIMTSSNLVEKDKNESGIYRVSEDGKDVLKMFGIDKKLVNTVGKQIS